jgi:hypothetical protein
MLRNVDGRAPDGARAEDLGAVIINAKKRRRWTPGGTEAGDPRAHTINVKNIDDGPPGGARAGGPGAATINIKNVGGGPLGGPRGGGGSGPHLRSKRCVVNLHSHDRQKVILLTGPILSALSSIMAHDP